MTEADRIALIQQYLNEVSTQFSSGHAREHSYRPALERLMRSLDKVHAVNEPKHSEHGAPDFVFLSDNNKDLILGYAEAKDINVNLDKTEKSEQMSRYGGYANLFLTDYLEFRFFRNGDKYETISLGRVKDGKIEATVENAVRLVRELEAFLEQTPEKIRSGKRLAQIMGGKARRIRDNVAVYLQQDQNVELSKIYEMMKKMLVHDLTEEKFADMYAQTLVYGLFVARYGDKTPETFSRAEARDLVPKSNPFLRHFFDHIVGPDFNPRLGYIVDELCEIFLVSNVNEIVHKHLRIADDTTDVKDPIIHFYEDFLQEYDAAERKRMGAYYTPIPVVQYIVHQVDRILKEDFGIVKGLASDETFTKKVNQGHVARIRDKNTGRLQNTSIVDKTFHRVQILDPAVGTATFLNETIKYIHKTFAGQEGRWANYVNDNLLKRLYGFELMMAPYTIAHLKLTMTLQETGANELTERLNVFLTNSLEEGVPLQSSLFDFGLAGAVSEESRLAADIKSEQPVMVVMGNPPYSVSSNNKSKWIQNLIIDYKKNLNERKINLDDDYIKFIRFAEHMIDKNDSGVVAMITNNSYIDGITHRQMRKHLLETFDKIYVLDLHGSTMKREVSPDGTKDENVFDIMQGVAIVLLVKTGDKARNDLGEAYHAQLFGTRKLKFEKLKEPVIYDQLEVRGPNYFFVPRDNSLDLEYSEFVGIKELFITKNNGLQTDRDPLFIDFSPRDLTDRIDKMLSGEFESDFSKEYRIEDSSSYKITKVIKDKELDVEFIMDVQYRPFDVRSIYYDTKIISRPAWAINKNMLKNDNLMLVLSRQQSTFDFQHVLVSDKIIERCLTSSQTKETGYGFPLYIYHDDNTRTINFDTSELGKFTSNLTSNYSPEDILDYIYGVLHSPSYRKKYKEFLKIDFPRIPVPTQAQFDRITPLGNQLRELHLMTSRLLDDYITTFSVIGDNVVGKVRYLNNCVWLNDTQYFGNVPEIAWNLYIGGYQPAQKWLKDRKGRTLSSADLDHYQKIIKVLFNTDRIMREIDS